MKALKHESATYVVQILSAIQNCYTENAEPTNVQLTALYSLIGKCICQQGETAFVAHLAKLLAEQLPQLSGFSMRNLRRMRDFYRTYENQPELMRKAQLLGWTQNAVILDCCDTNEQRSFYMELAAKKKLSKLALMKAITAKSFEAAKEESAAEECDHRCHAVDIAAAEEAVDTADMVKTACGAFVTPYEKPRQGDAMPLKCKANESTNYSNVFGNGVHSPYMASLKYQKHLISSMQKAAARIPKICAYLYQVAWRLQLWERPPKWQPPPLLLPKLI